MIWMGLMPLIPTSMAMVITGRYDGVLRPYSAYKQMSPDDWEVQWKGEEN